MESRIPIKDADSFKKKALKWAAQFQYACLLTSNNYNSYPYSNYEFLLGVDQLSIYQENSENAFEGLKHFRKVNSNSFLMGYISYDVKNELHKISSENEQALDLPLILFFQPRYLIEIKDDVLIINRDTLEAIAIKEQIEAIELTRTSQKKDILPVCKTSKEEYINNVQSIIEQIGKGDFYELNYCVEFESKDRIDPLSCFEQLNELNMAPFSAYLKLGHQYILCSSPERFLKKEGQTCITQPIKGTARKGRDIEEFAKDKKERAENIMITDLCRNDLNKVCEIGSVEVEELCKPYEFQSVHHLISTIKGRLQESFGLWDIIESAFPMGSMTGAPKYTVMKHIDQYENFKRGVYSGAIGYINENDDLDLNVCIRTIQYDEDRSKLIFHTGGAITYHSDPEAEYAECLLKAENLIKALQ